MSWGVYPEYCAEGVLDTDNFRSMLAVACEIGLKKGLVSNDTDLLVVTALEEPDHEAKRLLGDDGLHEDVVVPVRGPPPRPRGDSIAGISNRHHLRPSRRQVFVYRRRDTRHDAVIQHTPIVGGHQHINLRGHVVAQAIEAAAP